MTTHTHLTAVRRALEAADARALRLRSVAAEMEAAAEIDRCIADCKGYATDIDAALDTLTKVSPEPIATGLHDEPFRPGATPEGVRALRDGVLETYNIYVSMHDHMAELLGATNAYLQRFGLNVTGDEPLEANFLTLAGPAEAPF